MKITLPRPDDWHLHLRDQDALTLTVKHAAQRFARAIIMPNLKSPVTSTTAALDYRSRIIDAIPSGLHFEPLMTLYLTDNTTPAEIQRAKESGVVYAVKLYPAGATTNSAAGVTHINNTFATLTVMEEVGMPLLVHGEVTDPNIDIFDREKIYIEQQLAPLVDRFPRLRIVLEHITTRDAVEYIRSATDNIAATITAHHLLLNRNAMLVGGIQPHHYCLPVLKRESHRHALIQAATENNPKFFLGTDSAPHTRSTKERSCGCAGIYTSHAAMELYAEVFEKADALDQLAAFASHRGADFYKLPRNQDTITLCKAPWKVPESYHYCDETLIPFRASGTVTWKLCS